MPHFGFINSRKSAYTLAEGGKTTFSLHQFTHAFTLAEVLITLGIIGIIAALTLPSLMAKHQKKVVATRLKKFVSAYQQASILTKNEFGTLGYSGNYTSSAEIKTWWLERQGKYYKHIEVKEIPQGILFSSPDGSGGGFFINDANSVHLVFCVDYKKCKAKIDKGLSANAAYLPDGKNAFFLDTDASPYFWSWDGTRDGLFENPGRYGCYKDNTYFCAKLIQYDGWEIKDDYPFKF